MSTLVRSRSQSGSSLPLPTAQDGGRSLTQTSSMKVPKLKIPEPVKTKRDIHSSRSHLPPYPSSHSSQTTLVEDLQDVEIPDGPMPDLSEGPPQNQPQGPPGQAPQGGPPGPPAYDTTVKILEGYKLGLVIFVLAFALFLATLESTIISTSLVTIASELGGYNKASWVVVTYLLTYTSFLVVWTRFSDIFGRKVLLIATTLVFMGSSIACALSHNMNLLIGFRALQGIGGSGLYALSYASVLDVVPFRLMGQVSGALSLASACSSVLGPVLGGLITTHTTWRWVFWINVPCCVFIAGFVFIVFPSTTGKFTASNLRQIDVLGVFLSLGAAITLIVPLEEGGQTYAWGSIIIIFLIVASAIFWVSFAVWETWLTGRGDKTRLLPIFPMRLLRSRVIGSTFAASFLGGVPFMVVVVNLPQRFQIVNGMTASSAGIHMLPMLSLVAIGAFVAGMITAKINIAWYLLVGSSCLTTIGVGMLSTLPTSSDIPPIAYFYEILLGFGFGISLTALMVVVRSEVPFQDNAVATGAITQVRTLGGVIGLAICQAIMIHEVSSTLAKVLPPAALEAVLVNTENISLLDPIAMEATRKVFGTAINQEFRVITGFAAAAVAAAAFSYKKNKVDLVALEALRVARQNGLPDPADGAAAAAAVDAQNNTAEQDGGAQRCCEGEMGARGQESWDAESCQTWEGKEKAWEAGSEHDFYKSKWDHGAQSELWSLTNHPIPHGQLFQEQELSCPRCGFSILDNFR